MNSTERLSYVHSTEELSLKSALESPDVEEENGDQVHKHPDVDGGWAWIIAIGLSTFYFLIGGFFRSFGVVFAAILDQFGESASVTSLVPGIRAAALIVIGPASIIVSQRLSERIVITTGSVIVAAGFIMSYFAESLTFLIVSIGMMPGIGTSLIVGPANVIIGKYFHKRRASAFTTISSIGCIGQVVIPLLMVKLIEEYSVQGALLIFGGIALNVIGTGLVMRPIDLQIKTKVQTPLDDSPTNHQVAATKQSINRNQNANLQSADGDVKSGGITKGPEAEAEASEELLGRECTSTSRGIGPKKSFVQSVKRFIHDMYPIELLRNAEYCLIFFASILTLMVLLTSQLYLFVAAESNGFSKEQSAMLLSIFGMADMVSRIVFGQLADRKILQPQHAMATSCFASAIAICTFPLAKSIYSVIPLIIVIGGFVNVNLILLMPLLTSLCGLDVFPKAFSMLMGIHGLALTVAPPLFGLLVDFTGSYMAVFPTSGGCQIVSGILMVILCVLRKRKARFAKTAGPDPSA